MKNSKKTNREIDTSLYRICAKGSVEDVKALLAQGANPSVPHWEEPWPDDLEPELYSEDYYCIHEAARNPDIRVLDFLVAQGVDPNMFEYWRRQPLAYAAESNSLEMVMRLVELGNDAGNCDYDGGTVLSWAALNPDERVLEFLIESGAEIGSACYGCTEMDIALARGTPERVRFFADRGFDFKYISSNSFLDGPLDNIRVLLERGFDPDYDDGCGDGPLVDRLDPVRKALFVKFGAKKSEQ